MRTTFVSDKILNLYRGTSFTAPVTMYVGLITAVTDAEAGTVTEASYGSYARQALTYGAPAASLGGRKIAITALITFVQKTDAGSISVIALGIWDALSGGNLWDVIYQDGSVPAAFTCSDTANDLMVCPSHGFSTDQQVRFENFAGVGTLPGGLSENTTYWIIGSGLTSDAFKVSTTQGGSAVDLTSVGRGLVIRLTPKTVNQNDPAPQIAVGALANYDD